MLTPGAPGKTVDGTLVSLDTEGRLVSGSKTITLTSGSAGPGPEELPTTQGVSSSSHPSNETGHLTGTGVKVFEGNAEGLKKGLSFLLLVWKITLLPFIVTLRFFALI